MKNKIINNNNFNIQKGGFVFNGNDSINDSTSQPNEDKNTTKNNQPYILTSFDPIDRLRIDIQNIIKPTILNKNETIENWFRKKDKKNAYSFTKDNYLNSITNAINDFKKFKYWQDIKKNNIEVAAVIEEHMNNLLVIDDDLNYQFMTLIDSVNNYNDKTDITKQDFANSVLNLNESLHDLQVTVILLKLEKIKEEVKDKVSDPKLVSKVLNVIRKTQQKVDILNSMLLNKDKHKPIVEKYSDSIKPNEDPNSLEENEGNTITKNIDDKEYEKFKQNFIKLTEVNDNQNKKNIYESINIFSNLEVFINRLINDKTLNNNNLENFLLKIKNNVVDFTIWFKNDAFKNLIGLHFYDSEELNQNKKMLVFEATLKNKSLFNNIKTIVDNYTEKQKIILEKEKEKEQEEEQIQKELKKNIETLEVEQRRVEEQQIKEAQSKKAIDDSTLKNINDADVNKYSTNIDEVSNIFIGGGNYTESKKKKYIKNMYIGGNIDGKYIKKLIEAFKKFIEEKYNIFNSDLMLKVITILSKDQDLYIKNINNMLDFAYFFIHIKTSNIEEYNYSDFFPNPHIQARDKYIYEKCKNKKNKDDAKDIIYFFIYNFVIHLYEYLDTPVGEAKIKDEKNRKKFINLLLQLKKMINIIIDKIINLSDMDIFTINDTYKTLFANDKVYSYVKIRYDTGNMLTNSLPANFKEDNRPKINPRYTIQKIGKDNEYYIYMKYLNIDRYLGQDYSGQGASTNIIPIKNESDLETKLNNKEKYDNFINYLNNEYHGGQIAPNTSKNPVPQKKVQVPTPTPIEAPSLPTNSTPTNSENVSLNQNIPKPTYTFPIYSSLLKNNDFLKEKNVKEEYYFFGPYNDVFDQSDTNSDAANKLTSIRDKLIDGNEPICIIGYGQSGSGKTASLIFLQPATDGIIMELCNNDSVKNVFDTIEMVATNIFIKFSKDADNFDSFNNNNILKTEINKIYDISILFSDIKGTKIDNDIIKKNNEEGKYIFRQDLNSNKWIWNDDKIMPLEQKDPKKNEYKPLPLGIFIDKAFAKREVEPTPNNPNSSRSHVVVHLKFRNEDTTKISHLFLCDLAGVENKFSCDDTNYITEFDNKYKISDKYKIVPNDTYNSMNERKIIFGDKYLTNMDEDKFKNVVNEKYNNTTELFKTYKDDYQKLFKINNENIFLIDDNRKDNGENHLNIHKYTDKSNNDIMKKNFTNKINMTDKINMTGGEQILFNEEDFPTTCIIHGRELNETITIKTNTLGEKTYELNDIKILLNNSEIDINKSGKLVKDIIKTIDTIKLLNEFNKLLDSKTDKIQLDKQLHIHDLNIFKIIQNKYKNMSFLKASTAPTSLNTIVKKNYDDMIFKYNLDKDDWLNELSYDLINLEEVYSKLHCSKIRRNMLEINCKMRLQEGYMINKTLYDLRKDIEYIAEKNILIGDVDKYKPIVYYKPSLPFAKNSVLDIDNYAIFRQPIDTTTNRKFGTIVNIMKESLKNDDLFNQLNFCVFTVIHLTDSNVINNPPIPPYVNIADFEYKKLIKSKIDENKYNENIKDFYTYYKNNSNTEIYNNINNNNPATLIGSLYATDIIKNPFNNYFPTQYHKEISYKSQFNIDEFKFIKNDQEDMEKAMKYLNYLQKRSGYHYDISSYNPDDITSINSIYDIKLSSQYNMIPFKYKLNKYY
jgi:hypothetical protein